jgi:hypothetical protein
LQSVAECFAERAREHDAYQQTGDKQQLRDHVLHLCESLLDAWVQIASEMQSTNTRLQYQQWELGGAQRLLYDLLDPELANLSAHRQHFRANRSMRDVEPSVELNIRTLSAWRERP